MLSEVQVTDYILVIVWAFYGWIEPSVSFVAGAIIFYLLQIERGAKELTFVYLTILFMIGVVMGHYVNELLPYILKEKFLPASSSISFILGLVSKIVLDIVLNRDWIKDKLS